MVPANPAKPNTYLIKLMPAASLRVDNLEAPANSDMILAALPLDPPAQSLLGGKP